MRNSLLDQVLGFEGRLEGAHVDSWVHLEQIDFLQGYLRVDLASAKVQVRESSTDNFLLVVFIFNFLLLLSPHAALLVSLNQVDIVFNLVHLGAALKVGALVIHIHLLNLLGGVEVLSLMLVNHL